MGDLHLGLAVEAGLVAVLGALVVVTTVWGSARAWPPRPRGLLAVLAIGAAGLLWHRSLVEPSVAVVMTVTVVLLLVGARAPASTVTVPLAAVSLVGVWAAVPDTEVPLVAAVTAVVALVGGGVTGARPIRADRAVAVGLVVLASVVGAAGRPEVVGGIACLGLLVAPIPRRPRPAPARWMIVGHTALVLLASRGVTRLDRPAAVVASVGLLVVAVVVAVVIGRSGLDHPARDSEAA